MPSLSSSQIYFKVRQFEHKSHPNKANLRDLIAGTGLVIILKLDSNRWFFRPCNLEIWWMASKTNRAPLLYYIKFVHHFKSVGELKLELQSRNAQFGSKLAIILSCLTLKFDGRPWKMTGHLFYAALSFAHHFKAIGEFKLELQSGFWKHTIRVKLAIFCPVWPWNLMDDLGK